jgi:osmoprotectant transport system permease protein
VRSAGAEPEHRAELGGTQILWNALLAAEIDAYVEYTGTLTQELFPDEGLRSETDIRNRLAQSGVRMGRPLGFNNTYAIGMKDDLAARLEVRTISDLAAHPDLEFGFSDEFMERQDGWPGLQRSYRLPQTNVRGLEHNLAYRGLEKGAIQVMDLYSTDAEIAYYSLRPLEDDRGYFPLYKAVVLYRADLEGKAPRVVAALRKLEGAISSETMVELNARAKLDRVAETVVAATFLHDKLDPTVAIPSVGAGDYYRRSAVRLVRNTYQHLFLVAISLAAAIVVAVPLGILAYKKPAFGQAILGTVGVIQTLPSLALLVFMIPLLGLGPWPAIVALFLYSLLPIVRNTFVGLDDIPSNIHESALALGLPAGARLVLVELPLASRSILAGIKTAGVINVGTATIGALIGAGGYGQPILTGIRLDDVFLILEGAVPAAALALGVQGIFGLVERHLVPKGLRTAG